MEKTWICYHIYYQGNFRIILKDCVIPLLNNLSEMKLSSDYFYLCYWKNGPHLRLRIKSDLHFTKMLSQITETAISEYLMKNPSETVISAEAYQETALQFSKIEGEVLSDFNLESNNSFRKETYQPELHKYGGYDGVKIAEKIFVASSKLILGQLSVVNVSRKKTYVTALIMMFVAAKAFQLTIKDMKNFFYSYYKYWIKFIFKEDNKKDIGAAYESSKDFFINLFKEIYESKFYYDDILNKWYSVLCESFIEIKTNILNIKNCMSKNIEENLVENYLLIHFIHTHNNRYGVLASEEAFLGYLAFLSVKDYEDCVVII